MADLTIREVTEDGITALSAAFWEAAAADATIPSKTCGINRAGGWEHQTVVLLARNTNAAARTITIGAQTGVVVGALTGNAVIPVKSTGLNHADIPIVYSATADLEVALVRIGKDY